MEVSTRRGRLHASEGSSSEYPTFFDKPATAVIGPYDDTPFDPHFSEKMVYEAEPAIVIGRAGRSIPAAEAMDHIFGYTLANDVRSGTSSGATAASGSRVRAWTVVSSDR
jgi:2-keto-4-pentenoate hydratase/2-oxohepta-3-ene-1,7-dioic acid hydratase in catechol pathway